MTLPATGATGDDERYPMVLQDLLGDGWSVVEEGCPGAPPCLTTLLQKV